MIDITQLATGIGVLIGLVNGFRLFQQVDKSGFVFFLIALGCGILFGYFHLFGLNGIELGIVAALASSGLYRVGQVVGGK